MDATALSPQLHSIRQQLDENSERAKQLCSGLSDERLVQRPAAGGWSVAECAEHIALAQDLVFGVVTEKAMKSPADPSKSDAVKGKDEAVITMTPDRSHKFKAPEVLVPSKKFGTPAETLKHFNDAHEKIEVYVKSTQDDLRDHFADHPAFGTLDGYQWILLTAEHTRRHTAQILEVKADTGYPKK